MGEDAVDRHEGAEYSSDATGVGTPAAAETAAQADVWETDADTDPIASMFSDEIEDIDASDWDVDASRIWGDDEDATGIDDGGVLGLDFPL